MKPWICARYFLFAASPNTFLAPECCAYAANSESVLLESRVRDHRAVDMAQHRPSSDRRLRLIGVFEIVIRRRPLEDNREIGFNLARRYDRSSSADFFLHGIGGRRRRMRVLLRQAVATSPSGRRIRFCSRKLSRTGDRVAHHTRT